MRRFVTLVVLLLFTLPFGMSIAGCGKKASVAFCVAGDSGPVVGQLTTVTLQPKLYGISLNFAEIGQVSSPTTADCKGSSVSVTGYTYATTDLTVADINPTTGRLCGGTWNRNSGGGIADFTTCNPTNKSGTAYITATAQGVTSNPLPVYIHPVVTSVVLGSPSTDCINDPATNCSTASANYSPASCTVNPANGCCTVAPPLVATAFAANSCLSQGQTGVLAARVYAGSGNNVTNISCQAGHLNYTPQNTSVVTIDQNGVATAVAPGSTIINSNLSNAGSSAGFFSTCPPASISLTIPNSTNNTNVVVNENNIQPITATVLDTNGVTLTGLKLEYLSTTPTTLPSGGAASVTPSFSGAGVITAICLPPSCNPAPFNQIGLFGNGKQIISNPIEVTTPGTSTTVLYMASTQSLYLVPLDFNTPVLGTPVRLPYVPTSMVISNDGSTIYLGSATELMVFNALTNALSRQDQSVQGNVLAVSPDNTTLVIADPIRQLVYLYSAAGGIQTQYGGVATRAQFTPDSQTVYITAGNQLLVHSTFTGWTSISGSTLPALATPVTDVAVTVPSTGAFFAGATTTARADCPLTTVTNTNGVQTTTNVFYPDAGVVGPPSDRVAATNDGKHILGATVTPTGTLTDLHVSVPVGACPANGGLTFTATPILTSVLPGVTATSITGVLTSSDSSTAFVTYTGTGGVVPQYNPAASGAGTLSSVTLSGSAVAPVTGVFSSDNTTFYVGTTGDNQVHILTKGATGFVDTTTPIAPKLPDANGNIVVPNLLVQRPRKLT